jgi:hypothetical protein
MPKKPRLEEEEEEEEEEENDSFDFLASQLPEAILNGSQRLLPLCASEQERD